MPMADDHADTPTDTTRDPDLRLLVDGELVAPESTDGGLYSFRLASTPRSVRLLSRSMIPVPRRLSVADRRRLGISLWHIRLKAEGVAMQVNSAHPWLSEGFHALENDARWTDGFALLPRELFELLPVPFTVEVKVGSSDLAYPLPPEEPRPRVLVVDETVPTPDRDAGSNVMVEHIRLLRGLGYSVVFHPANVDESLSNSPLFRTEGVELAAHPSYDGLEHLLAMRGASFAAAYVHRVSVARWALPLLRRLAPQARVLFNNADLNFLRLEREAAVTGSDTLRQEASDVRGHELSAMAMADVSLICNSDELRLLRGDLPLAHLVYLPWVIGARAQAPESFDQRRGMMFLGGFAHRPNADAVIWLVNEVMPRVRELGRGVKLHMYGYAIPPDVLALNAADVVIEGYVESLDAAFARHRISVAPLRFGAGFKGKLAESMARGVPAVATGIAVEGTGFVDGRHVLVADDAAAFARAIVRLHEDPGLWERLSSAGRSFVRSAFSEEAGRKRMEEALCLADLGARERLARQ
jgi:glycosyltransferase involved in cell wall biosynthesis